MRATEADSRSLLPTRIRVYTSSQWFMKRCESYLAARKAKKKSRKGERHPAITQPEVE
jgi:hypothetical protein